MVRVTPVSSKWLTDYYTADCGTLICFDLENSLHLLKLPAEAVHFNCYFGQLSPLKNMSKGIYLYEHSSQQIAPYWKIF